MKILIIDTETANKVEQPLPYDVGYCIYDTERDKVLIERSYVVAEIFLDKEMMNSAYYAKKIPLYENGLREGSREMRRLLTIRKQIKEDLREYDCDTIAAYNLGFDKRACNNDVRFITSSMVRWFFPFGVKMMDIWTMACTSFLRSKWFIKWAERNGMISPAGNLKTSAEVAYRYITKNAEFEEEHTGLEDVRIETEILRKVLKGRMKYDTAINAGCWRIPQRRRKELAEEGQI